MKYMTHNAQILIATERERWLKLHLEGGISISELARKSVFSRDTLHRWKVAYLGYGLSGLYEKSRAHHFHPKTSLPEVVELIRQIRADTNFCAKKIRIRLSKRGIAMSVRGIHRVLKREGMVRSQKRFPRKDIWRPKAAMPGELVEIDVAFMRRFKGRWIYQFNAIDSFTRWKYFKIYSEQHTLNAVGFLEKLTEAAPFKIKGVKTDNASIFTNRYVGYAKSTNPLKPKIHPFDRFCLRHGIVHYLIDKGKPAQNGKVERSHRTDREEFWNKASFRSMPELERKQAAYAAWYNTEREHLGIDGLTPLEKLQSVRYDVA